jgi:hypothetical protein
MTDAPQADPRDSGVLPFPEPEAVGSQPDFVEALAAFLLRCPAWRVSPGGTRLQRGAELRGSKLAEALSQRLFRELFTHTVRYEITCVETWVEVRMRLLESPTLLDLLETLESLFLAAERPHGA